MSAHAAPALGPDSVCRKRQPGRWIEVPKQYHPVAGRPLVLHTLAAFAAVARLERTLVLLAPDDDAFRVAVCRHTAHCSARCLWRGTRAGTVANGLAALRARGAQDHDWVLVHDAARCLVTPALIDRLIDACVDDAVGGLLAMPVSDTVKLARGERRGAHGGPQRSLAGTDAADVSPGRSCSRRSRRPATAVTDESSAIEATGLSPTPGRGDASNFKVTLRRIS